MKNSKGLVFFFCLLSAGLCAAAVILRRKAPRGVSPAVPALFAYLIWTGAAVIWACSGKFFLREFSKQLFVLPLILYIVFFLPRKETAVRRLLLVLSAAAAFYALSSIDMASLKLMRGLFSLISAFEENHTGFESGTRLTGIFGNANISAGLLAIAIFLSLCLLESAETKLQRSFAAAFASLQATAFLLNFSMGATAFFLVSVVVYLVCAGERRSSVLLRMLEVAVPALIVVFMTFSFFEAEGISRALPLLGTVLGAAASVLLELKCCPAAQRFLAGNKKPAALLLVGVLVLACAYASAGLLVRRPEELSGGKTLRRSSYPAAGSYTLRAECDGEFSVTVISQDEQDVIMHTQNELYRGPLDSAAFDVPEGTRVVYVTFRAPDGGTMRSASFEGGDVVESLHIGYPLLPGFIANRLQGLRANENAIQRAAFFRDGMKVFREHPVIGAGLGGFESLIYSHQDFHYETRYVHNHYIQVLLDGGVIGFLLYLLLLLLVLAALLRGRKADMPFRALHPALCAAFAMIVLHSTMEVIMSTTVYLPYAYAVFALAAVCFGKPARTRAAEAVSAFAAGLLSLVYAVLIALNMSAGARVERSTNEYVKFFSALDRAMKIDAFEKNDWRVSYLTACMSLNSTTYKKQSDAYARELMDTPSNALHRYLIQYYLSYREYDHALEAARRGAAFNYSDSDTWNAYYDYFSAALEDHPEDEDPILDAVEVLYGDMLLVQDRLMDSTVLTQTSEDLVAKALADKRTDS